ncbi:hypothetical protein I4U23_018094 [Adineta vaga]|nr:hypothetical protein I4U23_018094 [Adineta vaga]
MTTDSTTTSSITTTSDSITTSPTTTTTDSTTTSLVTTTIDSTITSSLQTLIEQPVIPFIAPNCSNSNVIGFSCNISFQPCEIYPYCQNSGTCQNNPDLPHGYSCLCKSGYNGTNCEINIRPCQANTCLYGGGCKDLNATHFVCNCIQGRTGIHCETRIDYCYNVTCLNKGVCRSLPLGYECQCISNSFTGRHCENIAKSVITFQYISKTFSYIAILAISLVVGFVIILDILKYGFGIDPVRGERNRLRRERFQCDRKNRQKPAIEKQIYLRRTI